MTYRPCRHTEYLGSRAHPWRNHHSQADKLHRMVRSETQTQLTLIPRSKIASIWTCPGQWWPLPKIIWMWLTEGGRMDIMQQKQQIYTLGFFQLNNHEGSSSKDMLASLHRCFTGFAHPTWASKSQGNGRSVALASWGIWKKVSSFVLK